MSKLPPLPHWCESGSPFAEQMQAYATAATEPLLQRIAELEANEKVLLAQVQGHTEWREKIVKASEQAYGESAIRYKFSLTKTGKCMNTFPREIDGRWFALVPAEDDGHIGHIARIAELEKALKLVQQHHATAWNRGHIAGMAANRMVAQDALNAVKKDAWNNTQLTEALMAAEARCEELERQLEEARKASDAI